MTCGRLGTGTTPATCVPHFRSVPNALKWGHTVSFLGRSIVLGRDPFIWFEGNVTARALQIVSRLNVGAANNVSSDNANNENQLVIKGEFLSN